MKRRPKRPINKPVRVEKIPDSVSTPTAIATGPINLGKASVQRRLLLLLTTVCLLPFVNKAVHIDDPLFLWAAKHIVQHPLDPYGFPVVWYRTSMPMSEVMKNPPLVSYFLALVGAVADWSEPVLHLVFLLPALAMILGIHQLAREMTQSALVATLATLATLATPVFLVSATSLMCDVPMLALWLWAIIFWRKGIQNGKIAWLLGSAVLIGLCSLTKYFGACLIPLLFLYAIWNKRRLGVWALFLLIPIATLTGYQLWTGSLYQNGLLTGLTDYVTAARGGNPASVPGSFLVAMSFTGGCALPALLLVPWLWPRKWIIVASGLAILGTAAVVLSWVRTEIPFPEEHQTLLAVQLAFFLLGGASALSLAIADFWKSRDSDSAMLLAWVLGTFLFAGFLNWTVNGRSVLPMIPAIALLVARRLQLTHSQKLNYGLAGAFALSLALSLWVAAGDTALANSARTAAAEIHNRAGRQMKRVLFTGHWGFQYYMESFGGVAIEPDQVQPTLLDIVVIPQNNTNTNIQLPASGPDETVTIKMHAGATTVGGQIGAGFYSSLWGPLPYAFVPVPDEKYDFYPVRGMMENLDARP
jgi:hypothetical protein